MVVVVGEVVGRPSRRPKAACLGKCKHFGPPVREDAGEVMWNQTVQGSYFVLRVMTGSWKDLKWKSDLFRIAF